MASSASKLIAGVLAALSLAAGVFGQQYPDEALILCDCGIGDNKQHPTWSTSRQVDWYKDIKWPDSAYSYPAAPDAYAEVPYGNGKYPWVPSGVTVTMGKSDVWTAYINDGTPDGFKAGNAVNTKSGQMLNCWAYRGRVVSAAVNTTVKDPAVCWSAFVCDHHPDAPARPADMGSETSTRATSSAPPSTSYVSETPATPTTTGGGSATQTPETGALDVKAGVNPRFLNWQNTWQSFISNFAWDQTTGRCIGNPVQGDGYTIDIDCAGIQIDEDSHMTLLLIEALRDVGMNSLWFNQNPVVPANGTSGNSSWVVMPEAFSLTATDASNDKTIGYLSYKTKYDSFLTGPCSTCDTARFDKNFFDPIIAAMEGSYPVYNSYAVEAECDPWMVC